MSRPPPRTMPTGSNDRVVFNNQRSRIIGDPFAPNANEQQLTQINDYGQSVTIGGRTSGALMSRQQQEQLQSQDAANMLLDALEKYGSAPGAKAMLNWERAAAINALESGVYVTWRSRKGNDCTRIGPDALCFCGHDYAGHGGPKNDGWKKNKMVCDSPSCSCQNYSFIPRRPEECGEWWLPRRKEFDVRTYKAKCKCQHPHTDHDPKGLHRCKVCGCGSWNSAFLCVVCDCHSEDHETVWETESERISMGKPVGDAYMPFAEAPQIQKLVFNRKKEELQPRPGEKPKLKSTTPKATSSSTTPITSSSASSSTTSSSGARPRPAGTKLAPAHKPPPARKPTTIASNDTDHLDQQFASQHISSSSTTAPKRSASTSQQPMRSASSTTSSSQPRSSVPSNARLERQAFEAQLSQQTKQTSSAFKPVFD